MNTPPSLHRQVSITGLCYLIILFCGIRSVVALPGPLIDHGAVESTAQAINIEAQRFHQSARLLRYPSVSVPEAPAQRPELCLHLAQSDAGTRRS
jgi:hypothetical protein